MNKELLEKLSAIREDLLAFQAQATDVEKLPGLIQKLPIMRRSYEELTPYMTVDQRSRVKLGGFETHAEIYLTAFQNGHTEDPIFLKVKNMLVDSVTKFLPLMIADLDDIAKKLKTNAALTPGGTSAAT